MQQYLGMYTAVTGTCSHFTDVPVFRYKVLMKIKSIRHVAQDPAPGRVAF